MNQESESPQLTLWAPNARLILRPICVIEGCNKPQNARGWCHMHYARWRRNGDVYAVLKPRGAKAAGTPVYNTVHTRLKRIRGRASEHACVDCDEQASHWSYDNDDPEEVFGPVSRHGYSCRYSLDLDHYQPMCSTCHRWHDANAARERALKRKSGDTPLKGMAC